VNGSAEVWHIVKKDARQSRWLLFSYAVLVVAATLGAMTRETLFDGNLQWAAGLLLILGPIIAASLVQADSPTQADAFWASHPFRRAAIVGAKVTLVIGFLLVTPLIGQFLGLLAFEVPARERPMIMLASSLLYGLVLLLAVFLGALTRDLRGFILGIIAFFASMAAASIAASELQWSWNPTLRTVLQVLALAGIMSLFVMLYLRRALPYGRALGVATLALLLVASTAPKGPSAPGKLRGVPQTMQPGALTLELRDTSQISRSGEAQLRLSLVDGASGRHYRLDDSRAQFFLRNGATLEPPIRHAMPGTFMNGTMVVPGVRALRWVDDQFAHPVTDIMMDLTDEERSVLMRGVDSARIVGTMTVLEPRIVASLPLRDGANALGEGDGVSLEHVALGSRDVVEVAVKAVTSGDEDYDWMDSQNGFFAVVVDSAGSVGIGLSRGGATANPGLLVLPGAELRQGTIAFRKPGGRPGVSPVLDDEFLRGAKLLLLRWQPVAQYRVSASSVPLPPAGPTRQGVMQAHFGLQAQSHFPFR
jgi:ABC-type transport system involved in multi-copper enzyme maturation permease subunit